MQFGLQSPVFSPADGISPAESFAFQALFSKIALDSGFDCVSLGNHLVEGPDVSLFQPFPAAAALMAKFPELYVMTSSFCSPYYGSVPIAQEIATLDAISPGAFLFGLGQGYIEKEARAAGIEQGSRRDRVAETIAICRLLWSDSHATFRGEYSDFADADIGFRPAVPPPILVSADRPRTIARIPAIGGDYWLSSPRHGTPFIREGLEIYRRALDEAGQEFRGVVIQRDVSIAATKEEADDALREAYERQMRHQHSQGQPQPGLQNNLPFDQLKDERILSGTADQIVEQIVALCEITGTAYIHLRVHALGGPLDRSLDLIRQLGEEVLPQVRRAITGKDLFPDRRGGAGQASSAH